TPKRVEALKNAINEDIKDRVKLCEDDIEFALKTAQIADRVTNELEAGNLPVRVVHNDTKINNLLFDSKTGEPICVIDLDTVMPGSLLYDFGDALRIGASSAPEDEVDLDKVYFNTDLFKGFAKGYLESAMDKLTKKEVELLAFSAKLITYECGIRFLTDFLNGDTYFKTTRENHNIDRARNQFKIVRDIDNKMDELNRIIEELYIK
ncbi:MAG: aminoglycoside phosphotransferase family protein, partial [Clostridia bacterium]|nr:aminoglycoside phosphotransferase family protein [Clostridia bacterium]